MKKEDIIKILKNDSVYALLRYAMKNPSSSGIDNYDDDGCYELYHLVCELRKNN